LYESIAFEKLKKIRFTDYDGVAISDYNKGFLSEEHIEYISSNHDTTFLDTKKTLGAWAEKVSYIKINQAEYRRSEDRLTDAFEKKLIVTMGPRGARYSNVIYAVPEVQIKDLSGAGDTFIASLMVKYIETGSMLESIKFANESATLVVQRRGVGIVK
jgi:sugar/nucleoside kinase (ribokinase family)